jgi:site-specific recombinase XerD
MMNVLEPAMDWAWLSSLARYLKINARPERSRLAHMVPPRELYDLGLALMRKGRGLGEDVYHAATIARDGLMIAMLICCPLRIKNFKELSIGKQLLYDIERHQYWIKLSEEETKTGREYAGEYPIDLSEWIEWYLTGPRKQLLSQYPGGVTRHMWINRFGRPMGENAVRYQIELRTRDAFGSHVWPHLFRAISATGLVDEAPEKIAIAQDLLGHNDVHTTQKHYVLARGNKAHKQVHDALERARAETLSQLREHLGTIRRRRKSKAH